MQRKLTHTQKREIVKGIQYFEEQLAKDRAEQKLVPFTFRPISALDENRNNMQRENKCIYKAEVGTPLQKALVDNFEAQKQLEEVLNRAVEEERSRIVEMIEDRINSYLDIESDQTYCELNYLLNKLQNESKEEI